MYITDTRGFSGTAGIALKFKPAELSENAQKYAMCVNLSKSALN